MGNSKPKGDPGLRGEKGALGNTGDVGKKGDEGPKGIEGPKGASGEKGDKGSTGDKGQQGPMGYPGAQGPQGFNGTRGDLGFRGDPGLRGEKGEPGNTGDVGKRGEEGLKGASGEKGPKGEDGIGTEAAIKLVGEVTNTKVEISNIQKIVETNKNAAENATKKAQEFASKVTILHKQTELSAQRAEESKKRAIQSQRMTETFNSQVKEMFCKTNPEDQVCPSHSTTRNKRAIENFDIPPMTNEASRPTSFISQAITFFSSFIGEDKYKIENTIQEAAKIVDTIDVVKNFVEVLGNTALQCGIARKSLKLNPVELHSTIVDKSFNDDDELLEFLCLTAKKSCPECKQIDKFLATFRNSMQRTLANDAQHQGSFFNIEKIVDSEQPRSVITDITSLRNISEISQAVAGYLR